MKQVTSNVYFETQVRGCNVGFVTTKEGVVMIDTPMSPSDAVKWRDEIAKKGELRYLINTEPHGDHTTGNHFFSVTVISHQGTREALLATSVDELRGRVAQMDPQAAPLMEGYQLRLPTITFSQRLTLYLGDHTFELINLPGHTPSEVVVYIPQERVVFTGDNIFYKVQPWLHESVPFQWLESLKQIEGMEVDVLLPGHGEICDKSYIPELASFIQEWIDAVSKAIKQGMSLEEALSKISFLDRYPMGAGQEFMGPDVQKWNVARLYTLLSKK